MADGLPKLREIFESQQSFYGVYKICLYSVFALLLPVATLTVYIVLKHSRGLWGAYKYLVLHMLLWTFMANFTITCFIQPVLLLPYVIIIGIGPVGNLGPTVTLIFSAICAVSLVNIILGVVNSFVYNYLLVCHPHLKEFFNQRRWIAGFLLLELIVSSVAIFLIGFFMVEDLTTVLTRSKLSYLNIDYSATGVNPESNRSATIILQLTLPLLGIVLLLTFAISVRSYIVLRQKEEQQASRRVNMVYLRVSFVNLVVPCLLLGLPDLIAVTVTTNASSWAAPFTLIVEFTICLLPLAYCIVYLFLVTPYRRALIGFWRGKGLTREKDISNIFQPVAMKTFNVNDSSYQ